MVINQILLSIIFQIQQKICLRYTVIPGIQHIYTLSGKVSLCSKYRESYIRRTLRIFTYSIIFQYGVGTCHSNPPCERSGPFCVTQLIAWLLMSWWRSGPGYLHPCYRAGAHYNYVIMSTMTSQITSLTNAYSPVYSGVKKRKSKLGVTGLLWVQFTGDRWMPRKKGQ